MRVEALPDTVVVDASVGLKWVIDELGSDAAVALVAGRALVTSALFWVEAANVLATKERRGELDLIGLDAAAQIRAGRVRGRELVPSGVPAWPGRAGRAGWRAWRELAVAGGRRGAARQGMVTWRASSARRSSGLQDLSGEHRDSVVGQVLADGVRQRARIRNVVLSS